MKADELQQMKTIMEIASMAHKASLSDAAEELGDVHRMSASLIKAVVSRLSGESSPVQEYVKKSELKEALDVLEKLWRAVKVYDRIGFEGSDLLEVMSDARKLLIDSGRSLD